MLRPLALAKAGGALQEQAGEAGKGLRTSEKEIDLVGRGTQHREDSIVDTEMRGQSIRTVAGP
jgi:hypothetical protein